MGLFEKIVGSLVKARGPLQCPQCGYGYDHGFIPENYGYPSEAVPGGMVQVTPYRLRGIHIKCPSCGYFLPTTDKREVYNGDRILVLNEGQVAAFGAKSDILPRFTAGTASTAPKSVP